MLKKVKEKYTRHTRRVAHKSGKRTYYTTETYWTWDYVGKESKKAKKINFCGIDFKSNKIVLPDDEYIQAVSGINTTELGQSTREQFLRH